MKHAARLLPLGLVLLLFPLVQGCGGNVAASSNPTPLPSGVKVAIAEDLVTLAGGEGHQFVATVTGTDNTAVAWSVAGCTGEACGSVTPAGYYTAPSHIPADVTVVVKATAQADPNKFDTVTVHHVPVYVAVSDPYTYMGAGEGHQFTATVTGTSNTAVTWSLTDCSGDACGSITANGYYTAPQSITTEATVTIKATSQADPDKSGTSAVRHVPVAVKINPASAYLSGGGKAQFAATVEYDVDHLGVTWSLACSDADCGTLTETTLSSVAYTAPSALSGFPVVTLKASSVRDPNRSSAAVISVKVASSETLAEGDYAFIFDGWKTSSDPTASCDLFRAAMAGRFHADGKGLITSGLEDIKLQSGASETLAITGSYEVESDHRGTLTLTSAKGSAKYRMSLAASGQEGTFISFEEGPVKGLTLGSGSFQKQDPNAFSLSVLAGPYAFGLFSGGIWGAEHQAVIGRFETNAAGALSNGRMDLQLFNGHQSYHLGGSFSAPSMDTGRGSATMSMLSAENGTVSTLQFAYYAVSADKILLVGIDSSVPENSNTGRVLSGEARRQSGPFSVASLAGPSIFNMVARVDDWCFTSQDAVIGRLVADGRGSLSGVLDGSGNSMSLYFGDLPPSNQAFSASYTVDSDGRAVFTSIPAPYSNTQVAYFFGQNQAFLMDASADPPRLGRIEPQGEGPFDAGSISGPLVLAVSRITAVDTEIDVGWVLFDQNGGTSAVVDRNGLACSDGVSTSVLSTYYGTGTYTLAPNGRGVLNFSSLQPAACNQAQVFWAASPSKVVSLGTFGEWCYPVLMEFRQSP